MWRKIVNVQTEYEQHVGRHSWWQVAVHTVTLECGHVKRYRSEHPTLRVNCKDCDPECDCPGCAHDVGCYRP